MTYITFLRVTCARIRSRVGSDKPTNVDSNMVTMDKKRTKPRDSDQQANKTTAPGDELKQLHVNIPSTLHKKFRVKVLEEGRSMNQVIEDLIEAYIGRK
jgi:hypothetical protein